MTQRRKVIRCLTWDFSWELFSRHLAGFRIGYGSSRKPQLGTTCFPDSELCEAWRRTLKERSAERFAERFREFNRQPDGLDGGKPARKKIRTSIENPDKGLPDFVVIRKEEQQQHQRAQVRGQMNEWNDQ